MPNINRARKYNEIFKSLFLQDRLKLIKNDFKKSIFTTSLGMEDQVLTWEIANYARNINISTLDTGRLFKETQVLMDLTKERYGLEIKSFKPDDSVHEAYKKQYGIDGFYESVKARKACCNIRKVVPLNATLKGADAWITGLRREQSDNRSLIPFVEWDTSRQLMKFNPLADWTDTQLKEAVTDHEILVNSLHAQGYQSIGCEPCTRAIKFGEKARAGRWWWENDEQQECGLHTSNENKQKIKINLVNTSGV